MIAPFLWLAGILVASNDNLSGTSAEVYDVIPLKPLTHPSKVVSVFVAYEMISSSILIRPFLSTNPSVKLPSTLVAISSSKKLISDWRIGVLN